MTLSAHLSDFPVCRSSHEEKQEVLILHFAEEGLIESDSPPQASFFSAIDCSTSLLSVWKTYDVEKTKSMFVESFNDKGKWPCLNMRCNYVVPGYVDLLLNPPLLSSHGGCGPVRTPLPSSLL
eukprot:762429-Hanusia_phi.AAC.2